MKKIINLWLLLAMVVFVLGCNGGGGSSSTSPSGTQTLAVGQSATISTNCTVTNGSSESYYNISGSTITVMAGTVTLTCP